MPYTPGLSKTGGPYGSGSTPLSSYLPPGNLNTLLYGRSDYGGSSGPLSSSSSSYGRPFYGSSSIGSYGSYGSLGYSPSGLYPSSSILNSSSSSYLSSGGAKKFALPTISEHSINSSHSGRLRVSRPPKFNHTSFVPKSTRISSSAYSGSNRAGTGGSKIAVWNTEEIDVSRPRRPSRDENTSAEGKTEESEEGGASEVGTATPGELSRENQQFGTLRRNRTVIRIQTQHLKENPYLSSNSKSAEANKKPKKTAGEKLKEKWAIQSKKKKHSGYRPPSLTDIRAQQEAIQKEIAERQKGLLARREGGGESSSSDGGFSKSVEEEARFFTNPTKMPRRKSTKKFVLVRQCSKDDLAALAANDAGEVSPPMQVPGRLSRSSSNASMKSIFLEESSLDGGETTGNVADNEDDGEEDFWASDILRANRSTLVVRNFFTRSDKESSEEVESIHEEDEENCDAEVAQYMAKSVPKSKGSTVKATAKTVKSDGAEGSKAPKVTKTEPKELLTKKAITCTSEPTSKVGSPALIKGLKGDKAASESPKSGFTKNGMKQGKLAEVTETKAQFTKVQQPVKGLQEEKRAQTPMALKKPAAESKSKAGNVVEVKAKVEAQKQEAKPKLEVKKEEVKSKDPVTKNEVKPKEKVLDTEVKSEVPNDVQKRQSVSQICAAQKPKIVEASKPSDTTAAKVDKTQATPKVPEQKPIEAIKNRETERSKTASPVPKKTSQALSTEPKSLPGSPKPGLKAQVTKDVKPEPIATTAPKRPETLALAKPSIDTVTKSAVAGSSTPDQAEKSGAKKLLKSPASATPVSKIESTTAINAAQTDKKISTHPEIPVSTPPPLTTTTTKQQQPTTEPKTASPKTPKLQKTASPASSSPKTPKGKAAAVFTFEPKTPEEPKAEATKVPVEATTAAAVSAVPAAASPNTASVPASPKIAKTPVAAMTQSSSSPSPTTPTSPLVSADSEVNKSGTSRSKSPVVKAKSNKRNVFGLQNRAKSKEEKRKSQEEEAAKVVTLVTSAVVLTEDAEVARTSAAAETSETTSGVTSPSSDDSEQPMLNPVVQQLRLSTSRRSDRSSSGSLDSPCITPKSSERVCNVNCHHKCEIFMPNLCGVNQKLLAEALSSVKKESSTSTSSTLSAGTSGSSRRMPSPPTEESDDEDQETIARRICPSRARPKYRRYEIEDFHFLKVLGKGSFGKVMLAELKQTDCYFAIKCLKKDVVLEDDDVECTMIERKVLLMGSKHPYLCHLLCTFQTESHLFFVMEYLNGGDLMFHIQQTGRFNEDRARFYGAEIVSGLKFLHKKGIIYRDLKLDNILLDFEGHVRIADFGMCKLQIYLDRTADTFCGTPDYMAPEIIKGLKYNQCVDWWAFGILLYEMLIGQSPFSGCDEDELFWSICNEAVRYPRFLSRESKRILEMLLEKDASKRLGTTGNHYGDVKEQPFFIPINWDRLERRELEPPYKPKLKHSLDVQYFDTTFTREAARLTPVDKEILRSMDQTQFEGFSYTNPHTTD